MLETFTCATFAPLVGETFHLHAGGPAPAAAVLSEATDLPAPAAGPGRSPFSLVFTAPGGVLAQGTYRLEHPGLGAFEIFLVPIAAGVDGVRYEAVFT